MTIREIAQHFHNFCLKYIPPLSEFSHCFCPNVYIAFARISGKSNGKFGQKQWELRAKAMGNSGKSNEFPIAFARISGKKQWEIWAKLSNGKFGQKQWENLGKSNEKTRRAAAYISGKNYCFFPNFPLHFPEFPTAFARDSDCFCPNFPLPLSEFLVFKFFWGAQCPPCPPPRLLRL